MADVRVRLTSTNGAVFLSQKYFWGKRLTSYTVSKGFEDLWVWILPPPVALMLFPSKKKPNQNLSFWSGHNPIKQRQLFLAAHRQGYRVGLQPLTLHTGNGWVTLYVQLSFSQWIFDVRIVVTPLFSECQSCAMLLCIWGAPTIGLLLGQVVLSAGFLEEEIGSKM